MQNYFDNPRTAEELKNQYRKLAFEHHPDRGGDEQIMKAVNIEYERLFKILKDIHTNKDGEIYNAYTQTEETANDFIDIINKLIKLDGLIVELIGSFLWVTGNTKAHKETLKEMTFHWSSNKLAWYLKPDWYKKRNRKQYGLDEIRGMYGSQIFEREKETGLVPV